MPALHTHYHFHHDCHHNAAVLAALEELKHTMSTMSDQLDALRANVKSIETDEASVLAFVQGVPALIQTAVDAALSAGATSTQLQAFADLNAQLTADAAKIAADVSGTAPPVEGAPVPG